ncbi:hypothetical protein M9458_050833, partial [Cirrhinus mrigala]
TSRLPGGLCNPRGSGLEGATAVPTPARSGEPGLPGGTPARAPGEPGHPTLKPGLLTRPAAPSGEPGRWSPRERSYPLVTPRFDLGFGRLASDFQAARGTLRPRSGEPGLRLR